MASNNRPSIRIHRLFSNSSGNCAGLSRLKSNDSSRAKGDVFTFSTVFSCCPLIGPWIVNYYLCIRVLTQLIRHFPFFFFFHPMFELWNFHLLLAKWSIKYWNCRIKTVVFVVSRLKFSYSFFRKRRRSRKKQESRRLLKCYDSFYFYFSLIFIAIKIVGIIYLRKERKSNETANETNKRIKVFSSLKVLFLEFFAMWIIEGDKIWEGEGNFVQLTMTRFFEREKKREKGKEKYEIVFLNETRGWLVKLEEFYLERDDLWIVIFPRLV